MVATGRSGRFGQELRRLRLNFADQNPDEYLDSQAAFADVAHIDRQYLSRLETGERLPGEVVLFKLFKALKATETERELLRAALREDRLARAVQKRKNEDLSLSNTDRQEAVARTQENIARGLEHDRHADEHHAALQDDDLPYRIPLLAPAFFQNREAETELVARFIRDDATRLITVVGRRGIGKTALVCRLLRALESGNPLDGSDSIAVDGFVYLGKDGHQPVTFANLFSGLCQFLPDHRAVRLRAIFREPEINAEFKMTRLLASLPEGRYVALLDNFEDLLDVRTRDVHDADMNDALRAVLNVPHHGVTVVITSQAEPRLKGDTSGRRTVPLNDGLKSPHAENLLRELDATGDLGLKDAPDEILSEAQRRTNGYPRALLALAQILLEDRGRSLAGILKSTKNFLPDEVMQPLVGEAFGQLDSEAQLVMQALAIYNRPVTHTAIDYLLQPWLETVESEPILNRLLNRWFVRKDADYYSLHMSDRAYALDQIPEGEAEDRDAWRHPDRENPPPFVRFALRDCAASYFAAIRKAPEEWRRIEDLEAPLAEFDLRYEARDYDGAALVLREIDQHHLLVWGHFEQATEMYERLQGKLTRSDLRQHCSGYLGRCRAYQGRYHEAISLVKEALALAREEGDRRGEGKWLNNLSIYVVRIGQTREAIELLGGEGGALDLARESGNARGVRLRLHNLAEFHARLGETKFAKELIADTAEGMQRTRLVDDLDGWGSHYETLALLETDAGNYAEAIQHCRRAIASGEENLRFSKLNIRNVYLAQALLFGGDLPGARTAAEKACQYSVPRHNPSAFALVGLTALRQGDLTAARDTMTSAITAADVMLERTAEAYDMLDAKALALCGLALVGDRDRLVEAVATYRRARAINADPGVVQRVLRLLDELTKCEVQGLLPQMLFVAAGQTSSP